MRLQKITTAWFEMPDDPDKAKFEIKHLLSGDVSKILGQTSKRRFEFKADEDGGLQPVPVFESDTMLDRQLTLNAVIADWENIFDPKGKALECNDKNKTRLYNELEDADLNSFLTFVNSCRSTLAETAQKGIEAEKKTC